MTLKTGTLVWYERDFKNIGVDMPRNTLRTKCIIRHNAESAIVSKLVVSVGYDFLYSAGFFKIEISSPNRTSFRKLKNALVARGLPGPNFLELILCTYSITAYDQPTELAAAVDVIHTLDPIFYEFDLRMRYREGYLARYSLSLQSLLKALFPFGVIVAPIARRMSNNDKVEMLINNGVLNQEDEKKIDEVYRDPVYTTVMDDPVYFLHDEVVDGESRIIRRHYERGPILTWVRLNQTDPFTRTAVTLESIKPDPLFKQEIDEYIDRLVVEGSRSSKLKIA